MAEKLPENMILRSIFLPPATDRRLKRLAYDTNTSKAELIRRFVEERLDREEGLGEGLPSVRRAQAVFAQDKGAQSTKKKSAARPRKKTGAKRAKKKATPRSRP